MNNQKGLTTTEAAGYLLAAILAFALAVSYCNEVEAAFIECIVMPVCEVVK